MNEGLGIKVNGKEVNNPFLKAGILIMMLAIVFVVIGLIIMIIGSVTAGILVFAVLTIIPHLIMRMMGRQGFFTMNGSLLKIHISSESFRKIGS